MSYNVTIGKKSYTLEKCTLATEEKLELLRDIQEKIGSGATKRELISNMIEYVEMCMGEDAAKEAIGYTSIDDVDTKELEVAAYRIANAYNSKMQDEKTAELRKVISDVKNASGANIASLAAMLAAKK